MPEIRRDVRASDWHLSEAGLARASAFARRVDPGTATTVFTSDEPKALQTAGALCCTWGLEVESTPGLHEHERPEAQMLSRDQFESCIREMFARPTELVFGAETADRARLRFTIAVMRLIARTTGDVVAVSHGTVITLFAAEAAGVEPFAFWKRLEMPCAIEFSIPDLAMTRYTGPEVRGADDLRS
jgi:broad specificity phosphatase PhoE